MTLFDAVAAIGVLVTLLGCVRAIRAVRRGAPTEQVVGWFAVMLIAAAAVLVASRA